MHPSFTVFSLFIHVQYYYFNKMLYDKSIYNFFSVENKSYCAFYFFFF